MWKSTLNVKKKCWKKMKTYQNYEKKRWKSWNLAKKKFLEMSNKCRKMIKIMNKCRKIGEICSRNVKKIVENDWKLCKKIDKNS